MRARVDYFAQIQSELRLEQSRTKIDVFSEGAFVRVDLLGHLHTLRSLARKHERDETWLRFVTGKNASRILCFQRIDRIREILADHHLPMFERLPAHQQRESCVRELEIWIAFEVFD